MALALLSAGLSYVICSGEMFCVICGSVEKSQLLSFSKFQRAKLFFSLFQLSVLTVNLLKLRQRRIWRKKAVKAASFYTTADQLETWWDLQRKSGKSQRNFRFEKTIKEDTTMWGEDNRKQLSILQNTSIVVLVKMLHKQMFQHFGVTLQLDNNGKNENLFCIQLLGIGA